LTFFEFFDRILITRRKKGDKLKQLINKKVLVTSLIAATLVGTGIVAKNCSESVNSKRITTSTNQLIGMKESPIIKKNTNPLIFNTNEEIIDFYSKVFMLDYNLTNAKINEIINKDKDAFEILNILDNKEYTSKEEAIFKTIEDISKNPTKYGLNKNKIYTSKYELGDIKPEELVYKFATLLEVNPNIALAIAYCECGYKLNSYVFLNKHNIGGMRGNNGFISFKNEAYGIYKFVKMLKNGYKVTTESGTDKIRSMATRYCGGSEHWITVVTNYYNTLKNKGFEHYYNKGKHNRSLNIPYIEA